MTVSNSRDVFLKLVDNAEGDSWLWGLLSFAIFEDRRFEWIKHFEEKYSKTPTEDEIEHWYEQQTKHDITRVKAEAEKSLKIYAEEVVEEALTAEKKTIEKDLIVSEIRSLRKPWREFGISSVAGIFSALIFSAILIVLTFLVFSDVSPVAIGKIFNNSIEGTALNGQ